MFHSNTELLMEYWRAGRLGGGIPRLAQIDLADLAPLLSRMMVLRAQAQGALTFSLAGEEAAALLGQRLKGRDAEGLFADDDQAQARSLWRACLGRPAALVLTVERAANTTGQGGQEFELAFVPVADNAGRPARLIGHCQPLTPAGNAERSARPLRICAIASGGESRALWARPPLRLAVVSGRRVA